MSAPRIRVLIALNRAWNLYNFRAGLIRTLMAQGYEVIAVAPEDEYADKLKALGCRYLPLAMRDHGMNPLQELALIWRFWQLLREEKPDVYLGYTVKPNTYGSWVAASLGIAVINTITGLGTSFLRGGWLTHLVSWLYKASLRRSCRVLFQNDDDMRLFLQRQLVHPEQAGRVAGSGVDLTHFTPPQNDVLNDSAADVVFLFVGRLLRDKGLLEFVQAAQKLRPEHPRVHFRILGFLEPQNPNGIALGEILQWQSAGLVEYLGATDDVRPHMAQAHCVVLPSYREGTSRALLEAAAMGRPLITTDVVGCRHLVTEGVNGFLCPPSDVTGLKHAMQRFLTLLPSDRARMGREGRQKMVAEYDEFRVNQTYLTEIATCLRTKVRADC